MAFTGARFPDWSLPRAADLASGRQTGLGEPLFLRQIIIFNQGGSVFGDGGTSGIVGSGMSRGRM